MTAKGNPPIDPDNDSYDLFFYPRLYPSGWDLSEQPVTRPAASKSEPMPDSYEAFNEQRMFPSGWDLS